MKKDTKQKAILGIVLLIVIILCAVYVQLNNTNTANKYFDLNGADKLGLRVYLRYALFKYHET